MIQIDSLGEVQVTTLLPRTPHLQGGVRVHIPPNRGALCFSLNFGIHLCAKRPASCLSLHTAARFGSSHLALYGRDGHSDPVAEDVVIGRKTPSIDF